MSKPCPVCTYLNAASRSVCEMCDSVLALSGLPGPAAPLAASKMEKIAIEADNSCLFNAVGYLCEGALRPDLAQDLRGMALISTDPVKYNDAVLGKPVDEYVAYIQNPEKWGGGLELEVLSTYFNVQFIAVDVVTLQVFRFGGATHSQCGFLLFSGTHYDAIVRRRPDNSLQLLFAPDDVDALAGAKHIAEEANKRGAFTDLNNFTLMCLDCHAGVVGQKDAVAHAKATGHVNFGEYSKPK